MIFCVWHRNVTVTGERKKSIYHFLDILLFLLPYSFCQYRQQLVNLDWLCDMTIFNLIKTVRPVTFHIFKFPSGIARQSLHEFVTISSSYTVFISIIEGILK